MKKIIISIVILLLAFSVGAQQYKFPGGEGTTDDPYQISSVEDLDAIRGYLDKEFLLLKDLDLTSFLEKSETGWAPIGGENSPFTGKFDGGGRTIKGLWIDNEEASYQGLFGAIGDAATVTNIVVELKNIDSKEFAIQAKNHIGGIAGYNAGQIFNSFILGNAKIKGDSIIGGVAGANKGTISQCIAIAEVKATAIKDEKAGVLVGESIKGGTITSSFYAGAESTGVGTEKEDPDGITNKSVEDLKKKDTFGWDFTNTWCIYEGESFPQLRHALFSAGKGTAKFPYIIYSPEELNVIADFFCGEDYSDIYFELGDEMPLDAEEVDEGADYTLKPIGTGTDPFSGELNGKNRLISGLTTMLFGVIGTDAKLRNIYIEAGEIKGTDVGALVGVSAGTIDSCRVTVGTISGTGNVGGLVGKQTGGTISASFSQATVSGSGNTGGLVGSSEGEVLNCFAEGDVTGNVVGGLIGDMIGGKVTNCYSRGSVTATGETPSIGSFIGKKAEEETTIQDSYCLIQGGMKTVGSDSETPSSGITGKTAAGLRDKNTFATSWFGATSPWGIINGLSYPFLDTNSIVMKGGTAGDPIEINSSNITLINQYFLGATYKDMHFILKENIAISTLEWTPIGNNASSFHGTFDGNDKIISGLLIDSEEDYQGFFGVLGSDAKIKDLTIRIANASSKDYAIKGGRYVGAFAAQNEGSIENCRVIGAGLITGTDYVGGFVGMNSGIISKSFSIVDAEATDSNGSAGGFVGQMLGNIEKVYAAGNVSGYIAGGLIGLHSRGSLKQSYAVGVVSGEIAGGLIGQKTVNTEGGTTDIEGTIDTESYYNKLTTGQTKGIGNVENEKVKGLTTDQMLDSESFKDWDGWLFKYGEDKTYPYFVGETTLSKNFALSGYAYTYKGSKKTISDITKPQNVVGANSAILLSATAPAKGSVLIFNPTLTDPETSYLGVYMGVSESGIIKPNVVTFTRSIDTYEIVLNTPNVENAILLDNSLSFDDPIKIAQTEEKYSFSYSLAYGYSNYFVEIKDGDQNTLEPVYDAETKKYTVEIDPLESDMDLSFELTPGYEIKINNPTGIVLKGNIPKVVKEASDLTFRFGYAEGYSRQTHTVGVKKGENVLDAEWNDAKEEYTVTVKTIKERTTINITITGKPVVTIRTTEGLILLDGLKNANVVDFGDELTIRFKVDAPTYTFDNHYAYAAVNNNEVAVSIEEIGGEIIYSLPTIENIKESMPVIISMKEHDNEEIIEKTVTITTIPGIELLSGKATQEVEQYKSFTFTFKLAKGYEDYFVKLYESTKNRIPLVVPVDGVYTVTMLINDDKAFTFALEEPEPDPVDPIKYTVTLNTQLGIRLVSGATTNQVEERKPFTFSFKVDEEMMKGRYISVMQGSIHHTPILTDGIYSVTLFRVTSNTRVDITFVEEPVSEVKYKVTARFPLGVTLLSESNSLEVGEGGSCTFAFTLNEGFENLHAVVKSGDRTISPTKNSLGVYSVTLSQVRSDIAIVVSLSDTPANIEDIEPVDPIKISTGNGYVRIETISSVDMAIYDLSGRVIVSRKVVNEEIIYLTQGIYIVRCGNITKKVIVKN